MSASAAFARSIAYVRSVSVRPSVPSPLTWMFQCVMCSVVAVAADSALLDGAAASKQPETVSAAIAASSVDE